MPKSNNREKLAIFFFAHAVAHACLAQHTSNVTKLLEIRHTCKVAVVKDPKVKDPKR